MRCDLHVHSRRSGGVVLPLVGEIGPECPEEPLAVYGRALRRGMDLVTLTDHDSVEGALELAHLPNTFVSEEVTCELPGGRQMHLGVFGIEERQHARIALLRRDAEALFAYLAEQRIPACVNHPFSALTGRREPDDIALALARVPLVEARNGMMARLTNDLARRAGERAGCALVGGSDAHTLSSVARAYTVVPGARSKQEFLDGLRRGLTFPAGRSGGYARLTADVARLLGAMYRERARRALANAREALASGLLIASLPGLPLLPLVTAGVVLRERLFALRLHRLLEARQRALPGATASPARGESLSRLALGGHA